MYNERKDTFSVKDIIVQVLCILLFIFLLLWLFPTKSFIKKNTNSTYASDGSTTVEGSEQIVDAIFNFNVQTMKETAISYYTTSRLPKKVGDTDTMSLRKMLSEKLLLSFLDSDNKQCDLDNSYVQITKLSDEYTLKVNLVCPASKSDYIIVHLGCYDYCKGNVCEKKVTPAPKTYKCKVVNGVYWGSNSTKVDKATYEKQCTAPKTYKCKVVNGVYWGSNSTKVDKATYEKQCLKAPTPQVNITCSVVNGVYYDNTGKVTNQANYNNVCNKTTTPSKQTTPTTPTPTAQVNITCSVVNGIYYDNKGNVTNQANFNNVCNTIIINEPKYQCAYIDGQYWGKNYNKVDKATYEKECTKPVTYNCKEVNGVYWGSNNTIVDKATYEKQCKTIEYQYKKTETISGPCYWTASTAYTVREKTGTTTVTDSPYCDTSKFETNKLSADKKTCVANVGVITETKKECTATAKGNYFYNESLKLCVAEKYNDSKGGYKAATGHYVETGCTEKIYYDEIPTSTSTTTYTKISQTTDYSCGNPNCYRKKYLVKVCTRKYVVDTKASCTAEGYTLINGHCYYTKQQTKTTIYRCGPGETYNETTKKCEIITTSLCKSGYTKSKDGSTCEKTVDKYEDVTHYTASEYVCGASTTNVLEKWSLSANDKTLTDAGYKYTGVTRVK